MELKKILAAVDHTLLAPAATWAEIKAICDDAIKYGTATVCIPASYVARCKAYMQEQGSSVGVCTVIGFPTGYSTTAVKVFETADAVKNGADEVDMVINIGMLKDGQDDEVLAEINAIKDACAGKPDPAVYRLASERLGVPAEDCLVFEDIPVGILAGKGAGMDVCAIRDPHSAECFDEIERLADFAIDDFFPCIP